jgi:succinate dehydrogenase cytochrome b subunit
MSSAQGLTRSTIGRKIAMAASGVLLYGFVVVHMIGNLKVYAGPEMYNHYAKFLREIGSGAFGEGGVLWISRVVLLLAVGIHIVTATQLYAISRAARGSRYAKTQDLSFSYASRTMRWGGVIIAGFVVYHILHLTTGTAHPDFVPGDVYHNFVAGFSVWWVSAIYIATMIPLGFHMYHGLWSMTQTLGCENAHVLRWRRPVAAVLAGVVVAGNISFPLAVMAGLVR